MPPIISILIPTYNRKDMLRIALESILNQDYPHLEIVVSDNASTDGTEEFVNAYDDPRIKYIKRSENIGSGRNFQEGFKDCTGKYFFCLNDDDFLTNMSYFSKAVTIMEENPNISIIKSIVKIYYVRDNTIQIPSYSTKKLIDGHEYFYNYLHSGYENFVCWFTFVRRDDIVRFGGIQNHFAADNLMNLSACLCGDVYFLAEVIGQYNIWNNQASDNLELMNTAIELPYKLEALLKKSQYTISQEKIESTVNFLGEKFIEGSMKIAYKKQDKLKEFEKILNKSTLKTDYPIIYAELSLDTTFDNLQGIKQSLKIFIKSIIRKIIKPRG